MNGNSMLCPDAGDVPRNRITNGFVYGNDLALCLPETVMVKDKKDNRRENTTHLFYGQTIEKEINVGRRKGLIMKIFPRGPFTASCWLG